MLGGDDLLGADVGALVPAEAFDAGDAARAHDEAAPASAAELEYGPDEAQGVGLAGEAVDHLGAAADLDAGARERRRRRAIPPTE
jgi:hypothetical protein